MSNPQRRPASDLLLKLHWPSETGALSGAQYVVVELQDTDGLAVASMSVLKEQLLLAITQELDHQPLLSLEGCVSAISDVISLSQLANRPIPLDQLVADAVSPEMLEDEPEALQHLAEFRTRLLKSLEHVDTAITSLPKL
jgi:hypothetical protein